MMDIEKREWRVNPPRELQNSLAAMVRDFMWRFPRERRDMVVEYCKQASSITEAVLRATNSRSEDGKTHNHQSRVKPQAREDFAYSLTFKKKDKLDLIMVSHFDELFDLVEAHAVPGIGPVTVYDVAVRIGAYLEKEPTSLYLHAGVRQGVVALLRALPNRVPDPLKRIDLGRVERIERDMLDIIWPEFKHLPADEIEDFMCTYRGVFGQITRKEPENVRAPQGNSHSGRPA